jgi:AMP deaminase
MSNPPSEFPQLKSRERGRSSIALDAEMQLGEEPKEMRDKIKKKSSTDLNKKEGESDGDSDTEEDELERINQRLLTSGHDDEETKFYNNQFDEKIAQKRATDRMKRNRNFSIDYTTYDQSGAIPIPRNDSSNHLGGSNHGDDGYTIRGATPPAIAVLAQMQYASAREGGQSPARNNSSGAMMGGHMSGHASSMGSSVGDIIDSTGSLGHGSGMMNMMNGLAIATGATTAATTEVAGTEAEPAAGTTPRGASSMAEWRGRTRTMSNDILVDAVAESLEGVDTREILFENIPEPLPHTTQYTRLEIVEPDETNDDFDAKDSWDSCRKIQKCLDLRRKWISLHPAPPQDVRPPLKSIYSVAGGPMYPSMGSNLGHGEPSAPSNGSINSGIYQQLSPRRAKEPRAHPDDYRRRPVPEYEIFKEAIPDVGSTGSKYTCVMRRGVVVVLPKESGEDDVGLSMDDQATWRDGSGGKSEVVPPISIPVSPPPPGPKSPLGSPSSRIDPKDVRSHKARPGTDEKDSVFPVHSFDEFLVDFRTLRNAVHSGPVSSFSYKHLELLASKFSLHVLLNSTRELDAQKSVPHRDFYNIRKVDTHVHHSASMSQKHLLRFIKHKLRHNTNDIVIERDGKPLTLGEVFVSLQLTAYDLSIDTLDMHAHDTFHRFDRFNLKYNPAGQSRLREIFLKTDNHINGRYLAEMTQEVMNDLTASKYQLVEWRVSIYGRKRSEWETLAKWFYNFRLAHPNVRWLIQIPRLYHIYRRAGQVNNFQELLDNIFLPLFEISMDPHVSPELHYFLETVVGIDSVDDESRPEFKSLAAGGAGLPTPDQWTALENPPYGYWMYYTYANLCVLNQLRASRGLTTFTFRPHCGEAGDMDNLLAAFLTADGINHGILLRKNASLQYMYYLSQIGIAMSPLSNNKLFLDYHKNPFPAYFKKGLNVSLSTDDPLMLHYTKDPLLEEYSVAAQVWKMSTTDICEIARNSVLQSGWDMRYKKHFLGGDLADIRETNVPEIRISYRQATLEYELDTIKRLSAKAEVARAAEKAAAAATIK